MNGMMKITLAVAVLVSLFCVCAMSGDSDADPEVVYGSKDVGAYRISFDANGGSGGFSQYVLSGNEISFPTEYEADDPYNQYTGINKEGGYVLLGWSEDWKSSSPTYYPGQSYQVGSDKTFYAVWESVEYHRIYGDTEAEHIIVAKGTNVDLPGAYSILAPQMAPVYTLTVEYNGNERYSETKSPNTTMSTDWVTCTIDKSGVATISGTPDKSGIFVVTFGFAPTSSSNAVPTKWYVSVADPKKDPSVMYHVTYKENTAVDIPNGHGPYMTAVKLPGTESDYSKRGQSGWTVYINGSQYTAPMGGSYSVDKTDMQIAPAYYDLDAIQEQGLFGVLAYNVNGGGKVGAEYTGQFATTVQNPGLVVLSSGNIVSLRGYTFIGWNETGSASDPIYPAGYTFHVDSTYTELKAVWVSSATTVEVELDNPANHDLGTSFTAASGYTYHLAKYNMNVDGYNFLGWSTVSYSPGEGTPDVGMTAKITGKCTFYAVYERAEYTITIHYWPGNGTGSDYEVSKKVSGFPAVIRLAKSTYTPPEGYQFAGWATSKYSPSPGYDAGDPYTFNSEGTVNMFAIYEKTAEPVDPEDPEDQTYRFIVKFMGNGATSGMPKGPDTRDVLITECTMYVPSNVPIKDGYKFAGWQDRSTGTIYMPNGKIEMKMPEGQKEMTLTLYAEWKTISGGDDGEKVTVTYKDGTLTLYQYEIEIGKTAPYRTPQSRECYAFVGWYHNSTQWNFDTPVTESMELNAEFKKIFTLEINRDTLKVKMADIDASPITVTYSSDGFEKNYDTTSIPEHKVGYSVKGTVTVKATVSGSVLEATCGYTTPEEGDVPVPEPEGDNTVILAVSGVVAGLLVIGCGLYWRYRI